MSLSIKKQSLKLNKIVNTVNINLSTSHHKTEIGGVYMRCAIYARVSTEMDGQKTSIDNQIKIFKDYAAQRNWEIVEIYEDKKSGTKNNRPGLKKLIEDGKKKVFDVILVKELSRLARNGALSYGLKDIFDLYNIHLVCLDNSVNTLEKNDSNYGLFAWLYEMESNNSSRRNKQAKRIKAKQGLFVGSNPPYGYISQKGKLVIRNDETPVVVKRIFNEYLEGRGMDTIAKGLFNDHIPTPSQIIRKKNASEIWHSSTIKNILTNRHYCGDLVQIREETISVRTIKRRTVDKDNQIIIRDTHEPIVSVETFNAVEKMLEKRTKAATAPSTHLFSNLIYCQECGKGLWYRANSEHYRCGGYIRHGERYCLNKLPIRLNEIKRVIQNDLKELFHFFRDDSLINEFESKMNENRNRIEKAIKTTENKIGKLELNKRNYLDLYTEGIISKEDLIKYRNDASEEIEELNKSRSELSIELDNNSNGSYSLTLKKKLEKFLLVEELNKQMINTLVEKISWGQDGELRIHYSFENPLQMKKEDNHLVG